MSRVLPAAVQCPHFLARACLAGGRPHQRVNIHSLWAVQDAHLVTGSQPCNAHTWDTTRNKYFGENTVEYTARYDRLCCSSNVGLRELRLVGNEPTPDGSFLSDHFGILCKLVLRT